MKHPRSVRFTQLLAVTLCVCTAACEVSQRSATPSTLSTRALKKKPPVRGHGEISSLSFEELFSLHDSDRVLLFDARPAYFFQQGHIPKAIHLSADDCNPNIQSKEAEIKAALAAGKTIVVYCAGIGCKDARTLSRHLSSFGYPVSVFSGGWRAWTNAQLPTETSPTP